MAAACRAASSAAVRAATRVATVATTPATTLAPTAAPAKLLGAPAGRGAATATRRSTPSSNVRTSGSRGSVTATCSRGTGRLRLACTGAGVRLATSPQAAEPAVGSSSSANAASTRPFAANGARFRLQGRGRSAGKDGCAAGRGFRDFCPNIDSKKEGLEGSKDQPLPTV